MGCGTGLGGVWVLYDGNEGGAGGGDDEGGIWGGVGGLACKDCEVYSGGVLRGGCVELLFLSVMTRPAYDQDATKHSAHVITDTSRACLDASSRCSSFSQASFWFAL